MSFAMVHPEIEALGYAESEHQFNLIWAPRGWERVAPEVAIAAETTGTTITDLSQLTKAELLEFAATQEVEVPTKATKDDIIEAIRESETVAANLSCWIRGLLMPLLWPCVLTARSM